MSKTVAEVMTPEPITVQPETPLKEAIKILAEKRISGLPVVDQAGQLVGEITETDLMWQETGADPPPYITFLDSVIFLKNPARYEKELHKALGQTVGEVMGDKPVMIKPQQSVHKAAQVMHDESIRRLLVIDENKKIVGIVTRGDIIRSMVEQD